MGKKALMLAGKDNVAVLLDDLSKGEDVEISGIEQEYIIKGVDDISLGHKIALIRIEEGDRITKYGEVIGVALARINVGEHVHIHNMQSTLFKL